MVFAICAAMAGYACAGESARDGFHPPETEAERAIAKILELNSSETYSTSLDYYLIGYRHSPNDAYYATLITKSLRDAVIKAEQAELDENCGGKFIDGELCGMDINPVNCSNDMLDAYFYRTERQTDDEAIVSYKWPGELNDSAATYRLRKIAGHWMLDAISCTGYISFNWDSGK